MEDEKFELEQKKLQLEEKKLEIEKRKLRIEYWKVAAQVVIPVILVIAGFCQLSKQLKSQSELESTKTDREFALKEKQFQSDLILKERQFQSDLLLKALPSQDDSLMKKFIYLGFLDDSRKKYSFLIDDTVYVFKIRGSAYEDSLKDYKHRNVGRWNSTHRKPFGEAAIAKNFHAEIYEDGTIEFSFQFQTFKNLENLVATLKVIDNSGKQITRIDLPAVDFPHTRKGFKTIMYKAQDDSIKTNYNNIDIVNTGFSANTEK